MVWAHDEHACHDENAYLEVTHGPHPPTIDLSVAGVTRAPAAGRRGGQRRTDHLHVSQPGEPCGATSGRSGRHRGSPRSGRRCRNEDRFLHLLLLLACEALGSTTMSLQSFEFGPGLNLGRLCDRILTSQPLAGRMAKRHSS